MTANWPQSFKVLQDVIQLSTVYGKLLHTFTQQERIYYGQYSINYHQPGEDFLILPEATGSMYQKQ